MDRARNPLQRLCEVTMTPARRCASRQGPALTANINEGDLRGRNDRSLDLPPMESGSSPFELRRTRHTPRNDGGTALILATK